MTRKRRGRGEGSIYRRADGTWCGAISAGHDANGKRIRRAVYGKTKQETQDKLRRLQNDADAGRLTDAGTLTVRRYLLRWLDVARSTIQPTTHRRYEQCVRLQITPHIGTLLLNKLAPLHVEQLFLALEREEVSPRGRQMAGTVLHTALAHAVRLRLIPTNPARDVTKPRPSKREMRVWDADQVAEFLETTLSDRLHGMYVLALDSGMRQGELFGLQWSDVDFSAGTVLVCRSLEEIAGRHRLKEPKSGRARQINLSQVTLDALHDHRKAMLAEGHGHAPVFCDHNGGWLRKSNTVRRLFQPAIKRAGVPAIRFHDLRHTSATLLLLAGENPKVVSERLGHASIEITLNTYSHVLPTMQEQAARKMDVILRRKPVRIANG